MPRYQLADGVVEAWSSGWGDQPAPKGWHIAATGEPSPRPEAKPSLDIRPPEVAELRSGGQRLGTSTSPLGTRPPALIFGGWLQDAGTRCRRYICRRDCLC